jgi:hypothetical protein
MRVVELSNHPGGLLRDIHRRRGADGRRAQVSYRQALARHERALKRARARRDEAKARHRLWAWIRETFAVWSRARKPPRPPVTASAATSQEESIAAGMAGEQQVAADLGAVFGDEWVLFRGYRNGRGEIDHLLLGPGGLFAIEVKYHNATVYITGDDWRFEKFDRWGNQVEQGRIEDRTGRSPSVQLNEPADELVRFLRTRGQAISAARIVILNHPRSRVGSQRNATVRVTTSSRDIVGLVRGSRRELTDGRVAQIASLIERDHRFHEARTSPRRT